jgi:hypothetical protein
MFKHIGTLTALGLALALTACGGNGGGGGGTGGSGGGSTGGGAGNIAIAEGAWSGTNSLGNAFDMLVLEDGSLYSLYGSVTASGFSAAGFNVGAGSVSGNTLTGNLTQYDFGGHRVTGTLSANVVTGVSINGSATPSGGGTATTFTSTPLPASYPGYIYNTPAVISDIANGWNGNFLDGSFASFSIDPVTGALSGTNLGCSFTGTVAPRPSGKNVFNVSIHFGGSPCTAPNQDASGIAISYLTGGRRQLIAAAENSAKTMGSMFFALR